MLPTVEIAFEGVRHSDLIEGYIRGELESLGDAGAAANLPQRLSLPHPEPSIFRAIRTGFVSGLRLRAFRISTSVTIRALAKRTMPCRLRCGTRSESRGGAWSTDFKGGTVPRFHPSRRNRSVVNGVATAARGG